VKLNRRFNPPALWEWLASRLPLSMERRVIHFAYSQSCNIYRKGEAPGLLKRQFSEGDPIASVLHNEIVLHSPEYFSDFEDLLRAFESTTGIETTLTYWQSPKDSPDAAHESRIQKEDK
jgi:hypothetical protein